MRIIYRTFLILMILWLGHSLIYGQRHDKVLPKNPRPGFCYAKSLIAHPFVEREGIYPVYYGDYDDGIKLDSIYFRRMGPESVLVYVGKKDNQDEKIWEQYIKYVIVRDTSQTDEYVVEVIDYLESGMTKTFTEWSEVICMNKITTQFLTSVEQALVREGYLEAIEDNERLRARVKQALTDYQRTNNLPVGQYDRKTLEELGIYL